MKYVVWDNLEITLYATGLESTQYVVVLSNTLCGIGVKYAICCATVN